MDVILVKSYNSAGTNTGNNPTGEETAKNTLVLIPNYLINFTYNSSNTNDFSATLSDTVSAGRKTPLSVGRN